MPSSQKFEDELTSQADKLALEADEHRDILLVPTVDVYRGLPEKLKEGYKWVVDNTEAQYIVKTDDDSYLLADKMAAATKKATKGKTGGDLFWLAHSFVKGTRPMSSGKWQENDYPAKTYAPWPWGPTHIASRALAKHIADNKASLVDYQGEDVSMAKWVQDKGGVALISSADQIGYTQGKGAAETCGTGSLVSFGDNLTPDDMRQCYKKMQFVRFRSRLKSARSSIGPCDSESDETYGGTAGATHCQKGQHRTTDEEGRAGDWSCVSCEPGRHNGEKCVQLDECKACAGGFFMVGEGAEECTRCPVGWYQHEAASTDCVECAQHGTHGSQTSSDQRCFNEEGFEVTTDLGCDN